MTKVLGLISERIAFVDSFSRMTGRLARLDLFLEEDDIQAPGRSLERCVARTGYYFLDRDLHLCYHVNLEMAALAAAVLVEMELPNGDIPQDRSLAQQQQQEEDEGEEEGEEGLDDD